MSAPTKAKINLKERIIELEGSEAFVTKQLQIFQEKMNKMPKVPAIIEKDEENEQIEENKKSKKIKNANKPSPPLTIIPIPLDLKQSGSKPSLRAFVKEKSPSNMSEKVTVFAYYLKKHQGIQKMEAGHVVSCCKEVKCRVPRRINQMFYDIQRNQTWMQAVDGRKYGVINIAGENFVEFDLPRKKNVKPNQTTT